MAFRPASEGREDIYYDGVTRTWIMPEDFTSIINDYPGKYSYFYERADDLGTYVGTGSYFNAHFLDWYYDQGNMAFNGGLAQLLVDAGMRDPDWTFDVGETGEQAVA